MLGRGRAKKQLIAALCLDKSLLQMLCSSKNFTLYFMIRMKLKTVFSCSNEIFSTREAINLLKKSKKNVNILSYRHLFKYIIQSPLNPTVHENNVFLKAELISYIYKSFICQKENVLNYVRNYHVFGICRTLLYYAHPKFYRYTKKYGFYTTLFY